MELVNDFYACKFEFCLCDDGRFVIGLHLVSDGIYEPYLLHEKVSNDWSFKPYRAVSLLSPCERQLEKSAAEFERATCQALKNAYCMIKGYINLGDNQGRTVGLDKARTLRQMVEVYEAAHC